MEEEAARQAATNPPAPAPPGATAAPAPAVAVAAAHDSVVAVQRPSAPTATATTTDESEEALLQQALALSEARDAAPDVEMAEEQDGDENLTEEEMIARAIEMSMHPEPESEEKK